MEYELFKLAEQLGVWLKVNGKKMATAESCTGGWIAQSITDVPGSSAWFDRGFVTYSNAAKIQMLCVKPKTLEQFGAVSFETAKEMVTGALAHSDADVAVAVTGIAGPDGGSAEKPIGTVFIAWTSKGGDIRVKKYRFYGDRRQIRAQAVQMAIVGVTEN